MSYEKTTASTFIRNNDPTIRNKLHLSFKIHIVWVGEIKPDFSEGFNTRIVRKGGDFYFIVKISWFATKTHSNIFLSRTILVKSDERRSAVPNFTEFFAAARIRLKTHGDRFVTHSYIWIEIIHSWLMKWIWMKNIYTFACLWQWAYGATAFIRYDERLEYWFVNTFLFVAQCMIASNSSKQKPTYDR